MNEKFLKPYSAAETEGRIYKMWLDSGYFNPDNLPTDAGRGAPVKKPFTIIMPPPNANGHLHAGHALTITLQDIMIRYKRMQGFKALWVPGADHAGFETQIVYEKKLEKEGRSRFKMDPKQLYDEIMAFTLENKKYMEEEVRRLGASCDWSREKFTLDPSVVKEVQKTFKKMFDDGLVYRGSRIVNWCPKHETSLSDVETESVAKKDNLYFFKYGPFTMSTTRPETKFGTQYIVVHPDDARYAAYKDGQKIDLEWINGPVSATVVKDAAIDMEFGTGAMTITPWHSGVDFEIAERHGLEKEQIIDWRGRLLPIAGPEFAGQKIVDARAKIVEKLRAKGLLVKVEEGYEHSVPCCYKCSTPIEPQIKAQWFVKMKPLAELALRAVNDGKVTFMPDNFEKIFRYWMENTLDWNISRQIVWGIPIPAKFCPVCETYIVDLDDTIEACTNKKCTAHNAGKEGGALIKETDTFDTWFSSGQWPLLTLGYPDGADFKTYYPTDVMETGSDLIFKWIPRMVIFGLYLAKKEPFRHVYLHGMVNDAQGKKMSKSKGNVINPIDLIDKYGTDALRLGLVIGNTPGSEISLREDKIRGYKNFANKLWNIARFVFAALDSNSNPDFKCVKDFKDYSAVDKELLKEQAALLADVTSDMDNFRFHLAAEKLYHYVWHRFADEIIEESKKVLAPANKISRQHFLLHTLGISLRTLHPFMPFVTEEIWGSMPVGVVGGEKGDKKGDKKEGKKMPPLMIEKWPE
jgi:valyl-tRNA synthetase